MKFYACIDVYVHICLIFLFSSDFDPASGHKMGFHTKKYLSKKTNNNKSFALCMCVFPKEKKIQNLSVSISIIIANYSSSWKQWVNESPYGSILTNSWFVVQLFSIITSQLFFGLGHFKSRRLIVALFIKSRSLNFFFFKWSCRWPHRIYLYSTLFCLLVNQTGRHSTDLKEMENEFKWKMYGDASRWLTLTHTCPQSPYKSVWHLSFVP